MTDRLDIVFSALADPTRRRILVMLLEDDMAVTDVAEPFEMSLAAISKHLVVLAEAGLISRESAGRVTWCKLEPDAMREASVWMQAFGQFEAVDLDAFERFLEAELGGEERDDAALNPATAASVGLQEKEQRRNGQRDAPEHQRGRGAAPSAISHRITKDLA
jgi:DNA-binding transcriptional ArsR family regulator